MIDRNRLIELIDADPYAGLLGIRLSDGSGLDGTGVEVEMAIEDRHCNFLGSLHGGALFSLADCALSLASNHASTAVAVDTHLVLNGRAEVGDTITAVAEEVTRGRTMGTYRITISRSDGRTVGIFTGTVLLV